jgi:hypothetical protein
MLWRTPNDVLTLILIRNESPVGCNYSLPFVQAILPLGKNTLDIFPAATLLAVLDLED